MTFEELQQALRVVDLPERAGLREIKERHRLLAKRHHPDGGSGDETKIRQINAAYRVLLDYCGNYRFSFSQEEFLEQRPEERLRRQFAQDPVWGGGPEG